MNTVSPPVRGANEIRIQQYPALEDGNASFPSGGYQAKGSPSSQDQGLLLRHEIQGAPLIEALILEKKAVYACAVASPRSAHREFQTSHEPLQKVTWDSGNFGEPPYFTPMIVCTEEFKRGLNYARDGVHQDWHGRRVLFPKGARLAQGPVMYLMVSDLNRLLLFRRDETLRPGQFRVTADNDADFRFIVDCHPDLHSFLQEPGRQMSKRGDIMTHVVTACFQRLQQDYAEDSEEEGGWRTYKSLEPLANLLEDRNYPHWSEGSEFHPEEAATLLYPHSLPATLDTDEVDG